jgi:hypothetical protein
MRVERCPPATLLHSAPKAQVDIFVGDVDSSDDSDSAVVIAPVLGLNMHRWHGTEVGPAGIAMPGMAALFSLPGHCLSEHAGMQRCKDSSEPYLC